MIAEPTRVARLARTPDARNMVVPWFVAWIDGKPDFRVIGTGKFERAVRDRLCWICGGRLTRHGAFVIGPMCAVNRTTAEPPCHTECAIYAATHCPFLTTPRMRRRETRKPEGVIDPAGVAIRRNPGVALVWITREWALFPDGSGGMLIEVGEPSETLWFAEGRPATREEVEASITTGLPILQEMAEGDSDPKGALRELARRTEVAMQYLPVAS